MGEKGEAKKNQPLGLVFSLIEQVLLFEGEQDGVSTSHVGSPLQLCAGREQAQVGGDVICTCVNFDTDFIKRTQVGRNQVATNADIRCAE